MVLCRYEEIALQDSALSHVTLYEKPYIIPYINLGGKYAHRGLLSRKMGKAAFLSRE